MLDMWMLHIKKGGRYLLKNCIEKKKQSNSQSNGFQHIFMRPKKKTIKLFLMIFYLFVYFKNRLKKDAIF